MKRNTIARSKVVDLIRGLGFVPSETKGIEINRYVVDQHRVDGSRIRHHINDGGAFGGTLAASVEDAPGNAGTGDR